MSWRCEEVQERKLKPSADRHAYDLHLAALEWSLVEPIIINKSEDIKATNWRDKGLTPFTHQVQNLITFCRRLPVGLIADDVGLGKTISAGLILSELISRRKVSRTLIICPKVLTSQWISELEEKFGLFGRHCFGQDLTYAINSKTQIVVTTYHTASQRLENIQDGMFDMVILDEAHKLRNLYGGQSAPAIALNIRDTLKRRPFKYVLMLTATPIQNKIWDLYSLIDILKVAEGKTNPLGTPDEFSRTYLAPGTSGRKLRPNMVNQFQDMIRDCISRTRRGDISLHFPTRKIELFKVPLTKEEIKMIKVVADHIGQLNPMLQTSIAQAMMSSPRALVHQVENMVKNQTLPPHAGTEIRQLASRVKIPAKLNYLIKWIEDIIITNPSSWRVVLFTVRLETQAMLYEEFGQRGFKVGLIKGGDHHGNQRTIEAYKRVPPEFNLIISSDAGSEGINLQAGNTLINYDLPWNPMVVEQRIGRVQRLGSDFKNVSIGNLVGQGTVEEKIVGRLTEKLQGVAQAIGDIEGILEAANLAGEDGNQSFEGRIRDLVVSALTGVEVSERQRQMEIDIENARRVYEEEKKNIDFNLGNSGTNHSTVKAMPRIETKPPQLSARDFVLQAMARNGYQLTQKSDSLFEAIKPGVPLERISFSETDSEQGNATFGGQIIKQFIPGKPAFERLVQHWIDHHGHHVIDTAISNHDLAKKLASNWITHFPSLKLLGVDFKPTENHFSGSYHIIVKAATGVDSYEKLIYGKFNNNNERQLKINNIRQEISSIEFKPSQLQCNIQETIQPVVNSDKDISRFCDFYLEKFHEGMRQAGNDKGNERKLISDFHPTVHAEVVGLEGFKYDKGQLQVRVEVDSFQYSLLIPAIPASFELLEEPPAGECKLTGFRVPSSFLEKCISTGQLALRHKMEKHLDKGFVLPGQSIKCSYSGKIILRSEAIEESPGIFTHQSLFVTCQHTGKRIRIDRATQSFSGKWGSSEFMIRCPVSSKWCLPKETVICKATGRVVCIENAVKSKRTNEWFANDQLIFCDVTNKYFPPPDMVICDSTGANVLQTETNFCEVCNKRVRNDILATSAFSAKKYCKQHGIVINEGRNALPEEVGKCAITGNFYLLDELTKCQETNEIISKELIGICCVSGRALRKSLGVFCAATGLFLDRKLATVLNDGRFAMAEKCGICSVDGKTYLMSEFAKCDLTGDLVSKSNLGKCSITQANVRRDKLLILPDKTSPKSKITSSVFFYCPDLTVQDYQGNIIALKNSGKCAVSGIISHLSEQVLCQKTNEKIHVTMSAKCDISKKIVRKDILLKSIVSGKNVLPEFTVQLTDGGVAITEETGVCMWSRKIVILNRLKRCVLTCLFVCREYLNEDSEISILRDMLEGTNKGTPVKPEKLARLRSNPEISTWLKGKITENPAVAGDTYALACLHSGLLGINVKVYVAVMRSKLTDEILLGEYATLERRGGFWWILDT